MIFKAILIYFIFLCNVVLVNAQLSPNYDKILEEQKQRNLELVQKNPEAALNAINAFLITSQKSKNIYYETHALSLIDAVYMNTNEYKKLLQSCEKTIIKAKESKNFEKEIEALVRKSWALMHLGLLYDAKKILDDTALILKELDDSNDFHLEIIGNYWTCYQEYYTVQEKDQEAINKGNIALSVLQKIKKNQLRNSKLINVYSNIGSNYLFQKKTDSSAFYFKNAEKLIPITKIYDIKNEAIINSGLGMGYNIEGKYKEAIPYLMRGLEISKQNKYQDIYVETLNQLSVSFATLKDKRNLYLLKYLAEKKDFENKNKLKSEEIREIQDKNINFLERNFLFIIILVILVLLVIILYIFMQRKKRKISEQEKSIIFETVKEQSEEITELKTKVNDAFEEVLNLAKKNDASFLKRFSEVYGQFYNRLTEKHPELTDVQLKILALSYLNFSTKDIAISTKTSPRTVQTHKYNIRKLINISSDQDFIKWIRNF
ncbi:tetratricopeptide repeat protein [Chryseobacterium gambrini]|uniref:tetratricopeptide repeat protein n=1 Tax=Chryseobacterium gambrini TaxID=373672 RepID=UPI0022F38558|nr:LuxR C-terminal-related transcriptional regulator [Chryseobacterium gambrini]WBX95850.1 LuxR C-terminal-related transcriptional regulator [Chryseobacterium gambrini]